jgi:mono/diheme cytochrome c family protein
MLQVVKIVLVFASIPLAIIGFKRGKKALAIIAIVFLVAAYGLAEMNKAKSHKVKTETIADSSDPVSVGKALYTDNCAKCHGPGGDLGLSGAKNLKVTQLTDVQQKDIIKNGKPGTGMNPYASLTDDQLNGLVAYIKTLKQQ